LHIFEALKCDILLNIAIIGIYRVFDNNLARRLPATSDKWQKVDVIVTF